MRTLFLMPATWDLTLDSQGWIAVATDDYQQAQDIASSCRVFYGDDFYNKTDGIPYVQSILGKANYPLSLYRQNLQDRAMLVNGIVSVDVQLKQIDVNRLLSGAIIFTNENGRQGAVGL